VSWQDRVKLTLMFGQRKWSERAVWMALTGIVAMIRQSGYGHGVAEEKLSGIDSTQIPERG
jgi:hypothetical protein